MHLKHFPCFYQCFVITCYWLLWVSIDQQIKVPLPVYFMNTIYLVPILPELLRNHGFDPNTNTNLLNSSPSQSPSCLREIFHLHLLQENTQLGLLYSTKVIKLYKYFTLFIFIYLYDYYNFYLGSCTTNCKSPGWQTDCQNRL